jgi:transposase
MMILAGARPGGGSDQARKRRNSGLQRQEIPRFKTRRSRFYRRRHKIENFFCRIKDWRRIATRYDKLARNFLAATMLIGALYWIKL